MIRALHRWPGLLALALVLVLSLSGAALSLFPAAERLAAPGGAAEMSVAELVPRIEAAIPGLEQVRRAPSGRITAFWFEDGTPGAAVIDPATGAPVASADPDPLLRWLTNLHRSLFLGDAGRLAMAAGAAALLVLAVSGASLVARRAGGWRHWFAPLRGPLAARLHIEIARFSVAGLAFSALTALWMTASTFGLLPDAASEPAFPAAVSGQTGAPVAGMARLAATPVAVRGQAFQQQLEVPALDRTVSVHIHGTAPFADQGIRGESAIPEVRPRGSHRGICSAKPPVGR